MYPFLVSKEHIYPPHAFPRVDIAFTSFVGLPASIAVAKKLERPKPVEVNSLKADARDAYAVELIKRSASGMKSVSLI